MCSNPKQSHFVWFFFSFYKLNRQSKITIKWNDTKYANNEYDQREEQLETWIAQKKKKKKRCTRFEARHKNVFYFGNIKIYHNDENELKEKNNNKRRPFEKIKQN